MPPIEAYEIIEGQHVPLTPSGATPPGTSGQSDEAGAGQTGVPGATDQPPAGDGQPPASPAGLPSPSPGEGEGETDADDEPLRDDTDITAARLERRFARLTAARRKAERERDALAQQHQVELAQTRGQLEMVQRLLQGAAPTLPETPAQPTGPPEAAQFASHEDFVMAAARYGAQQELAARDFSTMQQRQQEQQAAVHQQLVERVTTFKQTHADYDAVMGAGYMGKVAPHVDQIVSMIPDGPALAYTLAQQPAVVQRLNSLPPAQVLWELGRLSGPGSSSHPSPVQELAHPGAPGQTTNGTGPAALPAPPTPLSGGGGGAVTGNFREDMSQQEYAAWRKRTSNLAAWKARA